MNPTRNAGVLAGAAAMALCASGFAGTDATTNDDLQSRINELEATVAELKAQNGDTWMTETRADEIRTIVEDVLADADTRASLLQGGGMAGWNGGFFLSSQDGNYTLNVGGYTQVAFAYNDRDVDSSSGSFGDETQYGFEVPRTTVWLYGHVAHPQWGYYLQFNSDNGNSVYLEDAIISYDHGNGYTSSFGQMIAPFLRERNVGENMQLAARRTVVHDIFTDGRTQGYKLDYQGDTVRWAAMFSDGPNAAGTSVIGGDRSTFAESNYAFHARAEFLFSGNWNQFDDFVSWSGDGTGLMLGIAGSYAEEGDDDVSFTDEDNRLAATVDLSYEGDGWSAFGAFVYQDLDDAGTDSYGVVVQAATFINDDTDVFGRFEWIDFDVAGLDDYMVITAGLNKYYEKHNLKATIDLSYTLDDFTPYAPLANFDTAFSDGQFVARAQIQLGF